MAARDRAPLVLGIARSFIGHEHELILRRDGSVSARNLMTGNVQDGLNLHEAAEWLRAYRVGSA